MDKVVESHHTTDQNSKPKRAGKRTQTLILYEKYRRIKERNRIQLKKKQDEEEKFQKMQDINKSGRNELQGRSSFEKQAANNEFIDFMINEYNFVSKNESGKLSNSLIEQSQKQQNLEVSKQPTGKKTFCSRCNFTIRQNDNWKFWWDTIILLIAIFNSITIPLTLSFDQISEMLSNNEVYNFINITSSIFFIMDIFLQMNTTYYDSEGEEISDKKKIRINYMFGMFFIDLISSLPVEIFFPGNVLRMVNILKIIRVFRLTGIINKMNVDEEAKSQLRMLHLIFQLILMMHLVASVWNFICKTNEYWIPPLDFVYAGKYPQIYRVYQKPDGYRYLVNLYNAVLFLGGNEMGPRTDLEITLCTIILVVMAIFNAWLFGDMAVLSEMSGRKQAQFQEQIDVANTAMKQLDLPPQLQIQVQEFLIQTQGTKSEQTQLKKFLEMISPSLQKEVSILIFSKVIQKNYRFKTVFQNKQNQLNSSMGFSVKMEEIVSIMISKFKTQLREPQDIVVQQFDETDQMFLIAKGACEVSITDEKKNKQHLKNLRPGNYFGEISLIYGCQRTADVVSSKYSTLAMLNKVNYKEILIEFPDLQEGLKKSIFQYRDRMKRFIMKSI